MKAPRDEPGYAADPIWAMKAVKAIEDNDIEGFMALLRGVERGGLNSAVTVSGGKTLLHKAVEKRRLKFVKALLRAGADPDARSLNHETPLHVAAKKDDPDIIATLVRAGANTEAAERRSRTPFLYACRLGSQRAVKALRDNGAEIHATDMSGWTGMHLAALSEKGAGILGMLRDMGLDVNQRDEISWTPMHWVAESGGAVSARALLSIGADPRIMSDDDLDAVDMARRKNNFDVLLVIQEHASLQNSQRLKQIKQRKRQAGRDAPPRFG